MTTNQSVGESTVDTGRRFAAWPLLAGAVGLIGLVGLFMEERPTRAVTTTTR